MSAHLRLLSAAHLIPTPAPARAPTSLHRLRLAAPSPAARLRPLRAPRLEESPRTSRCRCAGSAVARVGDEAAAAGIWEQVRDIVVFAGPALGLWICGPLMSLIDTMVIGQTSALQLAALGNCEIIASANTYAQIRGFAWPAVLVGLVAQSASLGMKDSWGPLKALAAASVINGVGDIFLCSVCGYGIAGAALATMVSQVVAAFMMMQNLNNKGFRAFSFTIPSARELLQIFEIAAPVFVTMTSKVAFYALLTYSATSMGAITLAAHQVMINILCMCTVWGEPLSQTAQSFMPELIYGANRNLTKARMLLKSLVIIGAITGAVLGIVGTLVPWIFPSVFTNDGMVVQQMHMVLAPYFSVLLVTPSVHSLEGTLLAGRDLRYLSQSMSVCFGIGTLLLMVLRNKFGSLPGCWWILVLFQWSRFASGLQRLISPTGMLYNENFNQAEYIKTEAT